MTGIKDVAREAGVSVSTVSYVLSGKRSISAKTTDKVMAAVERLGYTPDASARKMRGMRNHIFALSAPIRGDINQAKYNAYFLQTAWQAKNRGYDVLLLTGEDAVADIRRVTQSNLVDGVVLLDIEEHDERTAQAGSYSKPCVAIGYPAEHEGCACVDIDLPRLVVWLWIACIPRGIGALCFCVTMRPITIAVRAMCCCSARLCWNVPKSWA